MKTVLVRRYMALDSVNTLFATNDDLFPSTNYIGSLS